MTIDKFYIPWSPEMLLEGVGVLMKNIGQIANVGIWIFLILAGIAFIRSLI